MIGRLLERVGFPGLVRPFEHRSDDDALVVSLRTSPRYSILTVNGRELFFLRESGRFDGDGGLVAGGASVDPVSAHLRVVARDGE